MSAYRGSSLCYRQETRASEHLDIQTLFSMKFRSLIVNIECSCSFVTSCRVVASLFRQDVHYAVSIITTNKQGSPEHIFTHFSEQSIRSCETHLYTSLYVCAQGPLELVARSLLSKVNKHCT